MKQFLNKMEKGIDIIMGALVAILVIFAVFVYLIKDTNTFSELTGKYNYDNGFDSYPVEEIREDLTNISRVTILIDNVPYYFDFRYGPRELEDIPIDIDREYIQSKNMYFITIDHDERLQGKTVLASIELARVMSSGKLFNKETIGAMTEEYKDNPVITCADVNETSGVLYMKLANQTRIYQENNGCVVIEGVTEDDLLKDASKFGLYMLGIMRK
ncbi:hypothetical protein J4468_00995 [Candidatus Woesearchaeota archaeon]|nr:hypothetical protein [Candidatus Woesearchaeota archaeon]